MAASDMRPLLARSKKEPVNCAVGLADGQQAVILLDLRIRPKKLANELKKKAKDAKLGLDAASVRFGIAKVDPDEDPALVKLALNKMPPGAMLPKLRARLKEAGFGKLDCLLDAALEAEPDEPDQAAAPPQAEPAARPAPAAEASGQAAAGGAEAAGLTKDLTGLVRQMTSVLAQDSSRKADLLKLAQDAQASLKRGDLGQAQTGIAALREAVGNGGSGGERTPAQRAADAAAPAAPDAATVQKLQKSRDVWDATLAKLNRDLDHLVKTVVKASAGHALADSFEDDFKTAVEPLLTTVDGRLSDLLHRAAAARDGTEHQRIMKEARDTVGQFTKFVQSHPVIDHLDENPFVPLAVSKTLAASLSAVSTIIR